MPPAHDPAHDEQPLFIVREFRRAWGALSFRPQAMLEIASDTGRAMDTAIVFFLAGALMSYVGGLLSPFVLNGHVYHLSILHRILTVIAQVLLTIGVAGLMAYMARRFHAPVSFAQIFRVLGYAALVFLLTLFPALTLLAFAWWFAVAFVALRSLGQLDSERALLAVLCGVILLFAAASIFTSFGIYLWFGHWSPIRFF